MEPPLHSLSRARSVYLAGPDVFYWQAEERFEQLKRLCEKQGLAPVPPMDASRELPGGLAPQAMAQALFEGNMQRLSSADMLVANLEPFRGLEPDSGTVFELATAVAQGKKVAGYFRGATTSLRQRVEAALGASAFREGLPYDPVHGMLVEDFGHGLNLMLACSCPLFETAEEALAWLAQP